MPNYREEITRENIGGVPEGPPREKPKVEAVPEIEKEKEPREKEVTLEPEPPREQQPLARAPLPKDEDEEMDTLKEADKLRDEKFEGNKVEHLLGLAQTKGVDFAIAVARKTDDACLLDLLHDKLVERGLYKKLEE